MKIIPIMLIFSFVFWLFPKVVYAQNDSTRIDVLYFHATIRCDGCLTIEEYTKNSINFLFSDELKDSAITMKSIDFMQPENEHYQNYYQIDTQTLIVSKKVNGKEVSWKKLDRVWDYLSDYKKFQKYIGDEINEFLKDNTRKEKQ